MTKKQKKMLTRIITAAVLLILLNFLPVTGIIRFVLFLIPYLIVGYDILKKAWKGILNRQVFDENFLMQLLRSVRLRLHFMRSPETLMKRLLLCCFIRSVNFSRAMQLERAAEISVN